MKIASITVFENILGVILAAFIVFQVVPSSDVCRKLNEPIYIIIGLVFVVLMFITLNPIVGILFLIYFYQLLLHGKQDFTYKKEHTLKVPNRAMPTQGKAVVTAPPPCGRKQNRTHSPAPVP